jgi:hypothetical protein
VPETIDARSTTAWLTPARGTAPAGLLADAFLDLALAGQPHAADQQEVPAYEVTPEPGGFRSVQEGRSSDPGAGHRRITYRYRAPFQLLLRVAELDSGAVRTVLRLLQPEDADSTRVYTCLVLHAAGGAAVAPADVVAETAAQEAVLAEDLARTATMDSAGLPLQLRDELHVRADRLGVALRRVLADLAADAADADRTAALQRRVPA